MKNKRLSKITAKPEETDRPTVNRRQALKTLVLGSLTGAVLAACKAEPDEQPEMVPEKPSDDGIVELLFVQEAAGAELRDGSLILTGVKPLTLFFADRPEDIAGYLSYQEYVDLVYKGPDNFQEEPPNATLMILDGDALIPVVIELSSKPKMVDGNMIYASVKIINGEPPATGKTAVLFIDTVGRPMSPGSVAGVHRRHRRRRRHIRANN
jgi:hypothetical protein